MVLESEKVIEIFEQTLDRVMIRNIKSRFNNPTEKYLDELFNNWQN